MKRGLLAILTATVLILTLIVGMTTGLADAGGFSSDSDWGDSSSSWSSSDSDWSSSDSSWGSSSDYSSSSGGGDSGIVSIIVVAFIILVVIFGALPSRKKGAANKGGDGGYTYRPDATPGKPISELKKKDPNFSEAEFLDKVGNMYVQMQNAWQNKEWEPMRALMTDSLYNQMNRQLDALKQKGLTNYIDNICVMNSKITKYYDDAANDVIIVELTARITDYTVDSNGNVVSGSKSLQKFLTYAWTLTRDKNAKTVDSDGMQTVACPNCGAPVDVKKSARCEYCGTVVTVDAKDWVISSIKGISQRTAR